MFNKKFFIIFLVVFLFVLSGCSSSTYNFKEDTDEVYNIFADKIISEESFSKSELKIIDSYVNKYYQKNSLSEAQSEIVRDVMILRNYEYEMSKAIKEKNDEKLYYLKQDFFSDYSNLRYALMDYVEENK